MGRMADAASRRVRDATRASLAVIGRMIVADIKQHINEPVQKVGSEIIRSEPGEEPFREFGNLYKSIKSRIESSETLTIANLIVYTRRIQAVYLEYGTHNMEPRPFWAPAKRRAVGLSKLLKQMVAQRLRKQAADPFNVLDLPYTEY